MDLDLQNYLQQLTDKNTNKDNIIMNIGLFFEKNTNLNNPTEYSTLLPQMLVNKSITTIDINKVVDYLLILLRQEPEYADRIVWSIGKTFDNEKVKQLLSTILQMKICDDKTFQQIEFVVDVINDEEINNLYQGIVFLRNNRTPV
ncbi:MAG: hypothetical protein IKK80_07075 [Treponema sp.]|nr:hypothetical protein [Treponema sp.]